jgi:hypothetical protein
MVHAYPPEGTDACNREPTLEPWFEELLGKNVKIYE